MGVIKKMALRFINKDGYFYFWLRETWIRLNSIIVGDKRITEKKYEKIFGRKLDIENPKTLNEKIQWLKINSHENIHTILADKYEARKWLADRFGDEYLVPLLFETTDYRKVNAENIPNEPCIVKGNNGCGSYLIIRDKSIVDWKKLQLECKKWLHTNYYYASQEWQYKNIKPRIIVEKLLVTKDGKIPNDYKLHFINGELKFVYCSVDREGGNHRNIYDSSWKPLDFVWIAPSKVRNDLRGPEIDKPETFDKMVEIGKEIAKLFKYVRVDFYDVDGKLYYGEVTLHHGGGFDVFIPEKFDFEYGEELIL